MTDETTNESAQEKKPWYKKKWVWGLVLVALLFGALVDEDTPEDSQQSANVSPELAQAAREGALRMAERSTAERKERAAEERKERIEAAFDPWDGNHRQLEAMIKESLNDPDSYEHDETIYREQGDQIWIRTRFRARNMMGGMVRQQVVALGDLDGNVTEIIAHQYRGADGNYHDVQ